MLPGFTGFYGIPFALAAVVVAAWHGGLIAGLTTTIMSSALLYLLLPAVRMLDVEQETVWHLIVFTIIAFLLSDFEALKRDKQDRLRWEKASRDEFLGIMSHELRTPMTMVYSGVRILRRRWRGLQEPDRDELLQSIEEESEHLVNMTEDLLSLARLDDGRVAREPMLVLRIVERTVAAHQAGRPERQLDLSLPEESWVAMGQERYLTAVLRNLLTNADKYSAAGPPISVIASRQAGRGTIRVRDRGRGVSESQLEAIFEPYYRDPSLPAGPRGLGMGLSLCKRAVEAMGGSIWATRIEGGGLEVAFALPLVEDVVKAQPPVKESR